ncbi:MAG: nitronate monooxygenase family protein [Agathobacter sp.]|nr:nitronate monooxygenase family protein [Agathobacter sp.]
MKLNQLKIGEKIAKLPIVQGGMGVGVSRSSLAGAVAAAGGVGIISTAQIGYDEENFEKDPAGCNLVAIKKHIKRAKEIAADKVGNCAGLIGVNVMVALKHYREHVRAAVEAGADVVICGAGLPMDLPELVENSTTKIAPIVSSARACKLILKQWANKYHRTTDFIVVEGPAAGGHLGFHLDQLEEFGYVGEHDKSTIVEAHRMEQMSVDKEIEDIVALKKEYEKQFNCHIPVIMAGGVFDHEDVMHAMELGAEGVQIASRFVATYECDASDAYKQAYVDADEKDIQIIKSPVGLPGRALFNKFVARVTGEKGVIKKCYQCLEKCNPAKVPYCITKALIDAVKGDIENGLIFCGANVGKIKKMMSVKDLMKELAGE